MERDDFPTCPPELPQHPIRPKYFTAGMHVLFAFLTPCTAGIAAIPWAILYAVNRHAEERDYAEAMDCYVEDMSEYNADLAQYQAALTHRPPV
jgi:hypothetical protein